VAERVGLALLAVLLAGCVSLTLGPTGPPVLVHPHATGERDLLLRMNVGGGLPWPAKTIEEPPRFTLLGNGLAIYSMTIEDADGRSRNELHRAQLDDAQVDALLYDALGTGGLAAAQEQYRDIDVYDAGTTRFEIHAGGIDKAVSVYALGIADVMAPSRFERIAFSALASRLGRFEDDLVAGRATDSGLFAPEAYRVTLAEPLSPATRTEDWPWRDLVPADFTRTPQGDLVKTVTASQGEAVLALGYEHDLVLGAPDGEKYLVRIRPLMPDEVSG